MKHLGAAHSVAPFWRELPSIYRYGFSKDALMAIFGTSLLSQLFIHFPLLLLVPTMLLTRYAFSCLQKTAGGKMHPPELGEGFSGSVKLLLQLIGVNILAVALIIVVAMFVHPTAAIVVALLEVIALPAVFILLAIDEDLKEAVNFGRISQLVASTGISYIVLLTFIAIMISSIGILNALVGDAFPHIQFFIQNTISSYYFVIIFHMLGYLVFQNQEALGFYASDSTQQDTIRSEQKIQEARIEVLVKEGEYESALEVYRQLLPKSLSPVLWERCLTLMLAVGSQTEITRFSDNYLPKLMSRNEEFAVSKMFRSIIEKVPNYGPEDPELRISLAHTLYNAGDFKSTAKLLNNFHKRYEEATYVIEAYTLLANAIEKIPTMASKAESYRKFCNKLIKENQEKEQLQQESVMFEGFLKSSESQSE
ncbi:hypothetical protein GCM10007877_05960 [Marinibactrum halimedae]|uniref:Tetratricopeptide repeat protein n=2 Tax=Marinibactrum halimedae TaxID=1444977 RepID=A0AA37T934_9GAMM|nr:hypothetical protein GCM10007877_05960 [Marinibactrum halimedae]